MTFVRPMRPKSLKSLKVHFGALLRSKVTILIVTSRFARSPMDFRGPGGPGAPKVLKVQFGALWDLTTIDLGLYT